MPATSQLALPYPADADPADVPVDMQELADRLEVIVADGHLAGQIAGDVKISTRAASHGRWLLCSDRELTQAEIEAELALAAGKAAAFVALLGTGGSSVFGAASAGKVKVPEARGKVLLGQSASHPKTGAGSAGGVEAVTLTAAESGRRGHSHTSPTHAHSTPAHTHTGLFDGSGNVIRPYLAQGYAVADAGGTYYGWITGAPNTVATGSDGSAQASGAAAATIDAVADAAATDDHENMPPYRVLGNVFIRV